MDGTKEEIQVSTDGTRGISKPGFWRRAWLMYRDGFRTMTWGRDLWILMLIKLFIMFAILRLFFFPNFLNSKADTQEEKADYVLNELIDRAK